jgi:hypothetical protein
VQPPTQPPDPSETPPTINDKPVQKRLRRFLRQPEQLQSRRITDKGLDAVAIVERYRFIPTSLLIRLMPGDHKNNHRHLQTLYHHGLVNRFALGPAGEFIYCLDSPHSLPLLISHGRLPNLSEDEHSRKAEIIRYNRDNDYSGLHKNLGAQGKVLYIQHELMVSRFHALLELACRKFPGKVELEQWKQGPELWNRIEVAKVSQDKDSNTWIEERATEWLPHRPDAFFTLYYPGYSEDKQRSHFLYEADRGTENTTRYKLKLRAHWHFVVKRQLQRTIPCYGVHSIRAVLTESTTNQWAHNLRVAARHPIVSPKPSPLFWFTSSEMLTTWPANQTPPPAPGGRPLPRYLVEPEIIFKRIWANPTEEKLFNLAD